MAIEISPAAREYGERAAAKLMGDRKGHGGMAKIVYRQLNRAQLAAIASAAFQMGREYQIERGGEAR